MKKAKTIFYSLLITLILTSACSTPASAGSIESSDNLPSGEIESISENNQGEPDQDPTSDGPDYDVVFPQDAVNEITITISPENWGLMLEDMTAIYGEQGSGQRAGPVGRPGQAPGDVQKPAVDGQSPPPAQMMPGKPGAEMMGSAEDKNPVWVDAEFSFDGESWEHIGIRFKGNSSLRSTWGSGSLKLPFKLDFDQYEDEYPETEDQRFYGFKQLSFASNYRDDSVLREKIAADLFREAGVPSAQTAYYAVNIDYGEGPVYFGLYTAVEVVDDTLIESQFSDDTGNVYKPEGAGATFAAGSFSEASFDKETNQDEDDYSDILDLFDILHDQTRISGPENWRENLEAVFAVDTFLNWLAVNTVIQNWDTYGVMQHNYYLYNNPDTSQLVWIPWDNNESFKANGQMRDRSALQIDLSGVGERWPLISYLRDDPVYYQKYLSYLESFLENEFNEGELTEAFKHFHDLISPYVADERADFSLIQSQEEFDGSVEYLIQHTRQRVAEGAVFLTDQ